VGDVGPVEGDVPSVISPCSLGSSPQIAFSVVLLPAPLEPEQGDDLALGHLHRQAAQDEDDLLVDDLDVVQVEHRRGRR
jgi:hypothetical protein